MPDLSQLAAQVPATAWQNPQAAPMYPVSAPSAQVPGGQMPSWDPTQQAVRPSYASTPDGFPGQAYTVPPIPGYASTAVPASASSPLAQNNPIVYNASSSMGITQPGVPPNVNLQPTGSLPPVPGSSPLMAGAAPPGHQPYYG